ncbi:hypothetical protein FRC09_015563, partial [Ceratobasidium sp. 395]
MDRSNGTTSSSSATPSLSRASSQASTTGLTAYQARLLEGNSLSRAGSQNRGIFTPATTGPAAARRWAPSHRVSASVDRARGRREPRSEEQSDGGSPPLQSPARPMSSTVEDILRRHASHRATSPEPLRTPTRTADPLPLTPNDATPRPPSRTVEDILSRHGLMRDDTGSSDASVRSIRSIRSTEPPSTPVDLSNAASHAASTIAKSRSTPPFLKRRTLPEPVSVSSYLPPEVSTTSPLLPSSPTHAQSPTLVSPSRTYQTRELDQPNSATLGRTFGCSTVSDVANGDQPPETATL